IAALLRHGGVPVDAGGGALDAAAVEGHELGAVSRDARDLAILENHHVSSIGQDGGDIRRQIRLAATQPHHHATSAELRRDDLLRMRVREHGNGIGPPHFGQRAAARVAKIESAAEALLEEVRDDFGIGLRAESMTVGEQALLDRGIVLDDPVVDDHQPPGAIGVRVRVSLGRPTVGRPARVAEPGRPRGGFSAETRLEMSDLAQAPPDREVGAVEDGEPGGVIPAVLEPLEPLQNDLGDIALSDVADDSAHEGSPYPRRAWPAGTRRASRRRWAGDVPTVRRGAAPRDWCSKY